MVPEPGQAAGQHRRDRPARPPGRCATRRVPRRVKSATTRTSSTVPRRATSRTTAKQGLDEEDDVHRVREARRLPLDDVGEGLVVGEHGQGIGDQPQARWG